jgi:hypothetical protein
MLLLVPTAIAKQRDHADFRVHSRLSAEDSFVLVDGHEVSCGLILVYSILSTNNICYGTYSF